MYELFRAKCEALMPYLFVGACVMAGWSAAQHDIQATLLFVISAIGTLPIFHRESWKVLICK